MKTNNGFQCLPEKGIEFSRGLGINAVNTVEELFLLKQRNRLTLLIGVYDWSNYSWEVWLELVNNISWYENREIAVCVGCQPQLDCLSKELSDISKQCISEPIYYIFCNGRLVRHQSGRMSAMELQDWLVMSVNSAG